jgi:hypothetical protein
VLLHPSACDCATPALRRCLTAGVAEGPRPN